MSVKHDECKRFQKHDRRLNHSIKCSFNKGDSIKTRTRYAVNPINAVCNMLKSMAYPCRYSDMIPWVGRMSLYVLFFTAIDFVYDRFWNWLTSFNQQWLSRVIYNGHHMVHGLKYQSVTCLYGMIANFFGLVEGKRRDSSLLHS